MQIALLSRPLGSNCTEMSRDLRVIFLFDIYCMPAIFFVSYPWSFRAHRHNRRLRSLCWIVGSLLSEKWESGGERSDVIYGGRSRKFCNQQGVARRPSTPHRFSRPIRSRVYRLNILEEQLIHHFEVDLLKVIRKMPSTSALSIHRLLFDINLFQYILLFTRADVWGDVEL